MKEKVCAYARVSSNSRSQEHSFEFQSNYWNERLSNDSNYEYVGLYADKGISGKYSNRRPQFMLMVSAIKSGQINKVFCKSVQRFARNTEELLMYVRMFRELGVGVYFEKENIDTLTNKDDLYLTIAAAIAEDDLTRYSQNVTWSLKDRFKNGECVTNGRMYGYKMGKDGNPFEIIPHEADVIRRIYQMYIDGICPDKICEILNNEGVPSATKNHWGRNCIMNFLTNEKYVGDCLLQKRYTENGVYKINHGERDMYFVEEHHEAIVTREMWDKVQKIVEERSNPKLKGIKMEVFPFSGMVVCGCCGGKFRHKINHSQYTPDFSIWRCRANKDKCNAIQVRDEELRELFVSAYNEFITMKRKGFEEEELQKELSRLDTELKELTRLYANGWISLESYKDESKGFEKEKSECNQKLEEIKFKNLTDSDFKPIEIFDEDKVEKFLSKIIIKGKVAEFVFYNGVIIKRLIKMTRVYEKDNKKLKEFYGGSYDEI